jgi:hypothetical protein
LADSLSYAAAPLAPPHRLPLFFSAPPLWPRPIDRPSFFRRRFSRPAPSAGPVAPPMRPLLSSRPIDRPSRPAPSAASLAPPHRPPLRFAAAPLSPPIGRPSWFRRRPYRPVPTAAPLCFAAAHLAPPHWPLLFVSPPPLSPRSISRHHFLGAATLAPLYQPPIFL